MAQNDLASKALTKLTKHRDDLVRALAALDETIGALQQIVVENSRAAPAEQSVSQRLKLLRKRSRLTMAECAKALGYSAASGYQRFENPKLFRKKYLPMETAEVLCRAFVGRGIPPISEAEVMALAGKIG